MRGISHGWGVGALVGAFCFGVDWGAEIVGDNSGASTGAFFGANSGASVGEFSGASTRLSSSSSSGKSAGAGELPPASSLTCDNNN